MAARWRPKAEMTLSFDSLTPILYMAFVENFRLSVTVQKLFECIDLAGNLAFGLQKFDVFGGFDPEI